MSARYSNRLPNLFYTYMDGPLGKMMLSGDQNALAYLDISVHGKLPNPLETWTKDQTRFAREIDQLEEFFAGERNSFDLNIQLVGSDYNKKVWGELQRIPYGEAITYGELAKRIGQPEGAQAVGNANGQNPIPIIVPCHRVVAAKNSLGGFTGGIEKKQYLLQLEKTKNVQFNLF
ncbi:methylated-DNA--[protein]-cysteine S-methyltransferase [Maritalea sp.]|uniref:methylated-DNA--[protein]-cysteine S-methyltransferase n=1 Tax=Maritalea sp. TaxID=2003361 RepID=UPI003EF43D84